MTEPRYPAGDYHTLDVRVVNAAEVGSLNLQGYARGNWETFAAPLFGQGIQPVQILKSDERRGRAVFFSVDQDIYVASTEAELVLSTGSALPQGGYVPKGFVMVVYDGDPLYAISAQSGITRVSVHSESRADR